MKVNYNNWFYEYNKYIQTNDRGNNKSYNDTNWIPIMKRIKALESAGDDFITQPFGISGTERGFSHLLDLMVKSNYSFKNIDDSLMNSYKKTLQASMSNMTVNTNAVMLHCKSTDERYVSYDQLTRYYIIDIPFDQLHFGDRDEFIRQKIEKMHTTANDKYISIQEFTSKNYADVLGFSIIVTANGYFCNDCFIAIDEQTTQKLLMSQTSNKLDLTKDEIEKLTNMYNLEQKYTEDQIMDFSKALNTALEKLKDAQPGGGMRNPSQGYDSSSDNKKPQGVGLLEKMLAGILGLFTTNDSLLLLFGFFIAFYLFLRQIRKWFGGNSTTDKNASKKTIKIKKKVKKNE